MTLQKMLTAHRRVAWVEEMGVRAYLRVTRRMIDGGVAETIDLANVAVPVKNRGHGILTAYLEYLESESTRLNRTLFVENVFETRFRNFFLKRGYTQCGCEELPCFWKKFGG